MIKKDLLKYLLMELRDRETIKFTVIKEKNESDFENFSAAGIPVYTCKEKSSIDELICRVASRLFPQRLPQIRT
ncbi:MAG: hypothetical protein HZB76_06165 [Chlamydiae bacterium]|nr:hypothetical protein [Chlamydiota bacterium]